MIINKTKYLEFKCGKSPAGSDWHYVKRTNDSKSHDSAVCITTIVKKDSRYNFLLLKTRRPPIYSEAKAEFCIESPAGLIGDEITDETLLDCAKKELLEEAGIIADKIFIELYNSSTSAGLSSETLTYVTSISDDYKTVNQPVTDGGIIVERFLVPVDEIHQYLQNIDHKKYSVASATVCGIFFALKRI